MDISDDTMGNILSTTNENETENSDEVQPVNKTEESNLTSQIVEVNELQTEIGGVLTDNSNDVLEDMNLIVMGKSDSVKNCLVTPSVSSHIEEHEELWLGDDTRQLVKVDTDEDFEVIVKSLETAIVETDRYDIDTVLSTNEEPIISSIASDSLLEDIPSNLLTSAVPAFPLPNVQEIDIEIPSEISTSLNVNSLDDEFATISEPKVDSFDEPSSLFEAIEPEIIIPIENEPSLLEIQEATLPTDIPVDFQHSEIDINIAKQDDLEDICNSGLVFEENISNQVLSVEIPELSTESVIEVQSSPETIVPEKDQLNTELNEDSKKSVVEEKEVEEKNLITQNKLQDICEVEIASEKFSIEEKLNEFESEIEKENISAELKKICETDVDVTIEETSSVTSSIVAESPEQDEESLIGIIPKETLITERNKILDDTLTQISEVNIEIKNETPIFEESVETSQLDNIKDTAPNENKNENDENKVILEKKASSPFPSKNENDENKVISEKKASSPSPNKNEEVSSKIIEEKQEEASVEGGNEKNIQSEKCADEVPLKNDSNSNKSENIVASEVKIINTETEINRESQQQKIEIDVKRAIDTNKNEQSPPKKIKLVREKFQVKSTPLKTLQAESDNSNLVTQPKCTNIETSQTKLIPSDLLVETLPAEATHLNLPENIITEKLQSVDEIVESSPIFEGKESIEQILEKLEDPADKIISTVKPQKLKLKRNYKLPQKKIITSTNVIDKKIIPTDKIKLKDVQEQSTKEVIGKPSATLQDEIKPESSKTEIESIKLPEENSPMETVKNINESNNVESVISKTKTQLICSEELEIKNEDLKNEEINVEIVAKHDANIKKLDFSEENVENSISVSENKEIVEDINAEKLTIIAESENIKSDDANINETEISKNVENLNTISESEEMIEAMKANTNISGNVTDLIEDMKLDDANISEDVENVKLVADSSNMKSDDANIAEIVENSNLIAANKEIIEGMKFENVDISANLVAESNNLKFDDANIEKTEISKNVENLNTISKTLNPIASSEEVIEDIKLDHANISEDVEHVKLVADSSNMKSDDANIAETVENSNLIATNKEIIEGMKFENVDISANLVAESNNMKSDDANIEKTEISKNVENLNTISESGELIEAMKTNTIISGNVTDSIEDIKLDDANISEDIENVKLVADSSNMKSVDANIAEIVENSNSIATNEEVIEDMKLDNISENVENVKLVADTSNMKSDDANIAENVENPILITANEEIIGIVDISANAENSKMVAESNNIKSDDANTVENVENATSEGIVEYLKFDDANIFENVENSNIFAVSEEIVDGRISSDANISENSKIIASAQADDSTTVEDFYQNYDANEKKAKMEEEIVIILDSSEEEEEEQTPHVEKVEKKSEIENLTQEKQEKNLLKIDTQFPLLALRLQEKPKIKKISDPITLPTISQENVCKKLHEKVAESTTKRASFVSDHSATMESATRIKITKRKLNTPEPFVTRSLTKPLSVQIDDIESTVVERSHSCGSENIPKLVIKHRPEGRSSPKITIKPIKPPEETHSPKITIKPIVKPDPLKITITKQKTDDTHSILKIYQPEDSIPKLTIKSIPKSDEMQKISSPKVTVKPIPSPNEQKVTIKPVLSPRQIKLKFESSSGVTFEPICNTPQKTEPENPMKISVKSFARTEEAPSPKLTIKPLTKTCEIVQSEDGISSPLKLTIKPILKPEESYQSPKITIKSIAKPEEQQGLEESDKPERIILKIQKNNLPSPKGVKEVKIEEKLDKIKLKLTKEGSHAQIIPTSGFSLKRPLELPDSGVEKRAKTDFSGTEILHTSDISINIVEPNAKPCTKTISEEVTIMKIDKAISNSEQQISQSKFKEMLMKMQQKSDCVPRMDEHEYSSSSDDVKIVEVIENDPLKTPTGLLDESSSQDVMIVSEVINTNPFQNVQIINTQTVPIQTPKKRGRPRKNPLEVKPEIKGEDCIELDPRPKRTCRAPAGRTPFAVKERKPRGAGRGRGRGRGGAKSPPKTPKEPKASPRGKALKEAKALAKIEAAKLAQEVIIDEITIEDSTNDTPAATPVPPIEDSPKKPEVSLPIPQMVEPALKSSHISEELTKQRPPPAVYEEETRMSADNSSRAQTPAQVFIAPLTEGPEESQSSVQSTATTESSKTKKSRQEIIDPDSAVTTVDQIVEYSWNNGGPYMLQEQIAQFLGVKSFKRKYPGLTRRSVEMQERDYIREKGLVHESMCDMGLTAVPSNEILDIMYSDFQEKYEEYRKYLRDKQAKEISNKQKAVSLATSQEKNKIDFKERAIRSAAGWNCTFNKTRKESRKCCMDLQTFTINYPAGKIKVPHKNPVGHYPIALVPGQYTDYYKSYKPHELNYLPLNTVRYGPVLPNLRCEPSQSDGSQSDTDSSSGSDSDSSDDSMSTEEETSQTTCKTVEAQLTQLITPKSKVH